MKKEEIEHRIEQATTDREAITDKLIELKQQLLDKLLVEKLLEAKKPKLRHGDFGCFKDGTPRICIKDVIYDKDGRCGNSGDTHYYTILGNVFDLLKEWGEDLEEETTIGCVDIKIKGTDLHLGDYLFASLKSQERLWRIIGHAIVKLKQRKENKCS